MFIFMITGNFWKEEITLTGFVVEAGAETGTMREIEIEEDPEVEAQEDWEALERTDIELTAAEV